ncbi:UNVERIFIED_CONTAM: hypothetical protein Sradi_3183200 [Sesamum radiatum]|uniref:DUF4218 domain-containing protein n=1 Tax=Sesamum radiatum TaxID=300843 RepID=A0AAW2RET9_SESRA
MCNLEKIFSPAFFDLMEHLIVQLAYEAHVRGPVQYSWIYPFERFLRDLKKKVKNKAPVEAYIVEKIDLFSSEYFESNILSKRSMPHRDNDLTSNEDGIRRSIFNYPGEASGASKKRWLNGPEHHIIWDVHIDQL